MCAIDKLRRAWLNAEKDYVKHPSVDAYAKAERAFKAWREACDKQAESNKELRA